MQVLTCVRRTNRTAPSLTLPALTMTASAGYQSRKQERRTLRPEGQRMTHDQFVNLLHACRFRPCRLRTAGGRDITITHPENLAHGGERTAVAVQGDRWEILDIALIESVEGANEPTPAVGRADED
jgi:hypothetical protein